MDAPASAPCTDVPSAAAFNYETLATGDSRNGYLDSRDIKNHKHHMVQDRRHARVQV